MLDFISSERFWLPGNVSWSDLQRGSLCYVHTVPWLTLLLLILRNYTHWAAVELGQRLGVSSRTCNRPQRRTALEEVFFHKRRPSLKEEETIARKLGWTSHRVRRWFHRARNWQKPSTLEKFKENSWRLLFYSFSTIYGLSVLINEPYWFNLSECYTCYPSKAPSNPAMGYWCLQVAIYTTELISYLNGTTQRKKDFVVLLTHHLLTVSLLVICYRVNMVPIGLVIALLHDTSDVFLELAKLLVYIKCVFMANLVFVIFALVFIVTRLVLLPGWVLPSLISEMPHYSGKHSYITSAAIIFILGLLVLHVFWLILIGRVASQIVFVQPSAKDSRSDSELSDCPSTPSR